MKSNESTSYHRFKKFLAESKEVWRRFTPGPCLKASVSVVISIYTNRYWEGSVSDSTPVASWITDIPVKLVELVAYPT